MGKDLGSGKGWLVPELLTYCAEGERVNLELISNSILCHVRVTGQVKGLG